MSIIDASGFVDPTASAAPTGAAPTSPN